MVSFFPIKDKADDKHKSNLVYGFYPNAYESSKCYYVGETSVRQETWNEQHIKTDKNVGMYKYSNTNNYNASAGDFKIISTGFGKRHDRKICEALFIKDIKPPLNEQISSYKIELFN